MDFFELAVFRLACREAISERKARVLAALHRKKGMNLLELSEETEIELEELIKEINEENEEKMIAERNGKYFICNELELLEKLISTKEVIEAV